MLRNMVASSPVNQDVLVRTHAIATLGTLLQKVSLQSVAVRVGMGGGDAAVLTMMS